MINVLGIIFIINANLILKKPILHRKREIRSRWRLK